MFERFNKPGNIVVYHPIIRKLVPKPILKISEDFSISQYMLIFLLVALGMGLFVLLGIGITNMLR